MIISDLRKLIKYLPGEMEIWVNVEDVSHYDLDMLVKSGQIRRIGGSEYPEVFCLYIYNYI
ncbi:MAG: hypothetical protein AABY07_01100 [Nanoarchaeota archaeon]